MTTRTTATGRPRRLRSVLVGVAALVLLGAGAATVAATTGGPRTGDCVRYPGSGGADLTTVDCGSDDARYEVVGVDDRHRVGWDEFYSGSSPACTQFTGVDPQVRSDVVCLHSLPGT